MNELIFRNRAHAGQLLADALSAYADCTDGVVLVTLTQPAHFRAVGQWYEDFTQTTDSEVKWLLSQAASMGLHRHQQDGSQPSFTSASEAPRLVSPDR